MANILGDSYYSTMDQEYQAKETPEIGVTIFEGAEGRFPQSVASKIKMGAGAVELQISQEDFSKGLGAESYGEEARQDIKDLAKFNEVKIHSVHMSHTPNLSGLGRGGFNEAERDNILNEIAKEIDFASDVTEGGTVVVHTGEYPRPMAGTYSGFEEFPGEEREADFYLVDDTTGQIVQKLNLDQRTRVIKRDDEGNPSWIKEGKDAPTKDDFKVVSPHDFLKEVKNSGKEKFIEEQKLMPRIDLTKNQLLNLSNEELAVLAFHNSVDRDNIEDAKNRFELEKSEYEGYKLQAQDMKADNPMKKIYDDRARAHRQTMESIRRSLEEHEIKMKHTLPIKEVALKRSADTLAQAGIMAFEATKEKVLPEPLVMAPENIFPGQYGSHPQEMVEMVERARKQMVERLTKQYIEDPSGKMRPDSEGNKMHAEILNPFFKEGLSKQDAEKIAEEHIKATLDTQHLGMWKRHFKRKVGETEAKREKRFNDWYVEQVEKLADKGIIANVHVVDGIGRGHSHLPLGQGRYPVQEAIEKLRAKGKVPFMSSEGHGEGPERQLTEAWARTGKGIYSAWSGKSLGWTEVAGSYLGSQRPPGYIVGDYAKQISQDFTLWSGVPLE